MDKKPAGQPQLATAADLDLDHIGPERHVKHPLRRGDLCPTCRSARLDYNGMLNLACPQCGYALGGCFS